MNKSLLIKAYISQKILNAFEVAVGLNTLNQGYAQRIPPNGESLVYSHEPLWSVTASSKDRLIMRLKTSSPNYISLFL